MIRKNLLFLTLLLSVSLYTDAKQFLYPVAAIDNEIYVILQIAPDHLELFKVNPTTKVASKGLLSTFIPADFKVLPNGKGFSFNNQGRIFVKSPHKRSPKSIQLYAPIEDISVIEWIDDQTFYCMGKRGKHFGILQSNLQGIVTEIVHSESKDFMYPQKVNDSLFFIQRDQNYHYSLAHVKYPTITYDDTDFFNTNENFEERVAEILRQEHTQAPPLVDEKALESIIDFGSQPAAFLHMVSEDQGYFVEHPALIERDQQLVEFTYHTLYKDNDGWHRKPLFNFTLPAHFFLLSNEFRLYESLLPLLPRPIQGSIYFTDCIDKKELKTDIFKFDVATNTITCISHHGKSSLAGDAFFAPLVLNSMIFYGGTVNIEELNLDYSQPCLWINDDGLTCVDIPVFFDLNQECIDCLKDKIKA